MFRCDVETKKQALIGHCSYLFPATGEYYFIKFNIFRDFISIRNRIIVQWPGGHGFNCIVGFIKGFTVDFLIKYVLLFVL